MDADEIAAQPVLDTQPRLLRKRIDREEAADAIVTGLRSRDPRVLRARTWAVISRLRGVLGPTLDSTLTQNDMVQDILGRLDAREGKDLLTS